MKNKYMRTVYSIIITIFCVNINAQETSMQQAYQERVVNYDHNIKAAIHAAMATSESVESAKADLKPKIDGNANFNFTGNPLKYDFTLPDINKNYIICGRHTKYGASLTISQNIYSGGARKARVGKAKVENETANIEIKRITNNIRYYADQLYWNNVAKQEIIRVAEKYRKATATLVNIVKQRVEQGYTNQNDLLMAEVRLNDAEYQLQLAQNEAETARLTLNSLAGVPSTEIIEIDTILCSDTAFTSIDIIDISKRPELAIAQKQIDIKKYAACISDAEYKPNFSVGINGNYSSPGYDFKAAPDPNYSIYATLSIPIFEWGKRGNSRRMGQHATNIAKEELNNVADGLQLEAETAKCNYLKAYEQIKLTASSLHKAEESLTMSTDKYKEGSVSVIEVINAQLYYLEAYKSHINSKLNACMAKSSLEYAHGY